MKISKFFFLSCVILAHSSFATEKGGTAYEVYGYGSYSCGSFISAADKNDTVSELAYTSWLGGFLSSYNLKTNDTYSIIGNSDMEGAFQWIKNYCRANPLAHFSEAAHALTIEMHSKRVLKAD